MSILQRIPKDQIKEDFTHYALFMGFCPVYYKDMPPDGCYMAVRNWWPEWLMDMAEGIAAICIAALTRLDPDYEPVWMIRLQREIEQV